MGGSAVSDSAKLPIRHLPHAGTLALRCCRPALRRCTSPARRKHVLRCGRLTPGAWPEAASESCVPGWELLMHLCMSPRACAALHRPHLFLGRRDPGHSPSLAGDAASQPRGHAGDGKLARSGACGHRWRPLRFCGAVAVGSDGHLGTVRCSYRDCAARHVCEMPFDRPERPPAHRPPRSSI
jgi:hypothetical protein